MSGSFKVPDTAPNSVVNGGLNTSATSLSLSSHETPFTENTVPLIGGGVKKRNGTRFLWREAGSRSSASVSTLTTPSGIQVLVTKETKALALYGRVGVGLQRLVLKQDVFTERAADVRATIISTTEDNPRAIFLTGVNKPVQMTLHERVAYEQTGTSVDFDDALWFNGLTVDDIFVVVDGSIVDSFAVGYSSNTLTVSGLTLTSSSTVSVVAVTWQWWAESLQWFGSELYGTAGRVIGTPPESLVVKVPTGLTTDVDIKNGVVVQDFGIRAWADASGTAYTLATTGTISLATEYSYSDGTVPYAGSTVQPSPFFIVFGADGGANSTVHFTNRRPIPFTVQAQHLQANIDQTPVGTITSATVSPAYGDVLALDAGQSPADPTELVKFIAMESSGGLGVGQLSTVQVVNAQVKDINGSATLWRPEGFNGDGYYLPVNGLHQLQDSSNSLYPYGGVLFNERLILVNSQKAPAKVLVSAIRDRRGFNYNDFQIRQTNTDADGFDISIAVGLDEQLVSAAQWQNNLFLFTNRASYRLAGQSGILAASTFVIGTMTQVGIVNPQAFEVTDLGVFYLTPLGLYSVTSRDNLANEYDAVPKSLNVDNVFSERIRDRPTDWISYDRNTRLLYIGLDVGGLPGMTREVYVYNTQLQAWSYYTTPGNFHIWDSTFFDEKVVSLAATQFTATKVPISFTVLEWEYGDRHLDFYDVTDPDEFGLVYSFAPFPGVTHTTVAGIRQYPTSLRETQQTGGFNPLFVTDIEDVSVVLGGNLLTFSPYLDAPGDYVKLSNGHVFLKANPGAGQKLDIYPRYV